MKPYADLPALRARQLAGDVLLLCWVALWLRLAAVVLDGVRRLATPGRELEQAGAGLAGSLGDAARRAGDLPLVGSTLRGPLDAAAGAAGAVGRAGVVQQETVGQLALVLALLVAVLPIAWAAGRWLPARVRWAQDAGAAQQLRGDVDLLALRAATTLPLRTLRTLGPEPVARWRRGDPGAAEDLAALQLRALGLLPGGGTR